MLQPAHSEPEDPGQQVNRALCSSSRNSGRWRVDTHLKLMAYSLLIVKKTHVDISLVIFYSVHIYSIWIQASLSSNLSNCFGAQHWVRQLGSLQAARPSYHTSAGWSSTCSLFNAPESSGRRSTPLDPVTYIKAQVELQTSGRATALLGTQPEDGGSLSASPTS